MNEIAKVNLKVDRMKSILSNYLSFELNYIIF